MRLPIIGNYVKLRNYQVALFKKNVMFHKLFCMENER